MLEPGTPFFPLLCSGLEGLSSQAMDEIAEIELGLPEESVVGPGGQQFGDGLQVTFGGGLEGLVQLFGTPGLVLGEMVERHGYPP
jgi:hypothetical protein